MFVRVASEKENFLAQAERDELQQHFDVAEKALFLTLLLLRELSPGFKPPSTYSGHLFAHDGSSARVVGALLEPQLGNVHTLKTVPYLVPKALNGSIYARASGVNSLDTEAWKNSEEGFAALVNAFGHVREPYYLMEAGAQLADLYGQRSKFQEALEVVRYALATARTAPTSSYTKTFEGDLRHREKVGQLLLWRPVIDRRFHRLIYLFRREEHGRLHTGRTG